MWSSSMLAFTESLLKYTSRRFAGFLLMSPFSTNHLSALLNLKYLQSTDKLSHRYVTACTLPFVCFREVTVKRGIGSADQIEQHEHVDPLQLVHVLAGLCEQHLGAFHVLRKVFGAVNRVTRSPRLKRLLAVEEYKLKAEVAAGSGLRKLPLHDVGQVEQHGAGDGRIRGT